MNHKNCKNVFSVFCVCVWWCRKGEAQAEKRVEKRTSVVGMLMKCTYYVFSFAGRHLRCPVCRVHQERSVIYWCNWLFNVFCELVFWSVFNSGLSCMWLLWKRSKIVTFQKFIRKPCFNAILELVKWCFMAILLFISVFPICECLSYFWVSFHWSWSFNFWIWFNF